MYYFVMIAQQTRFFKFNFLEHKLHGDSFERKIGENKNKNQNDSLRWICILLTALIHYLHNIR